MCSAKYLSTTKVTHCYDKTVIKRNIAARNSSGQRHGTKGNGGGTRAPGCEYRFQLYSISPQVSASYPFRSGAVCTIMNENSRPEMRPHKPHNKPIFLADPKGTTRRRGWQWRRWQWKCAPPSRMSVAFPLDTLVVLPNVKGFRAANHWQWRLWLVGWTQQDSHTEKPFHFLLLLLVAWNYFDFIVIYWLCHYVVDIGGWAAAKE